MEHTINRNLKNEIIQALGAFRIILVSGPRQSGKTTLISTIAKELGFEYKSLDDKSLYNAANNDPKSFIESNKTMVIDEVQLQPNLINEIKLAVDSKNKKGMFLLSGSADLKKIKSIYDTLPGRMVEFQLYPISLYELHNNQQNLVDNIFNNDFSKNKLYELSYQDIALHICKGLFPEVLSLNKKYTSLWFNSYINSRIIKDFNLYKNQYKDSDVVLKNLINLLSANPASIINYSKIASNLQISSSVVKNYIQILELMYIVTMLPAYNKNIKKRVIKAPKIHFIDTGIISFINNFSLEYLTNSKHFETLGHLLENFILMELKKHATTSQHITNFFHYRDTNQNEVDILLQNTSQQTIGIEIKLSTLVNKNDFKGLVSLAKKFDKEQFQGYLIYRGANILTFNIEGYKFQSIPLSIFWG